MHIPVIRKFTASKRVFQKIVQSEVKSHISNLAIERGKRSTGKIVITREKYIGAHVDGSPGPTKQHPVQGWASTRSDNGPTDNTTCLASWIPGASPPSRC